MKKESYIKTVKRSFYSNIFTLKFLVLLLLFFLPLFANSAVDFTFKNRLIYDDNIFNYSKTELKAFIKNEGDGYLFKTYDDLITYFFARLKKNEFSFTAVSRLYLQNPSKSYGYFDISWQKRLENRKPFSLTLNYRLLPNYLIRYYAKKPCSFTEHIVGTEFSTPPFFFSCRNKIFFYNREFSYYNFHLLELDIKLKKAITAEWILTLALGGSKNRTIRQLKITEPDISYCQFEGEADLRKRGELVDLNWQFSLKRRNYLTKIDLGHKKRSDWLFGLGIGLKIKLKREVNIVFGYEYEERNAYSPYRAYITDIKDYNKNTVYLGLEKKGKL